MDERYVSASALCTASKLPASDYVINPYIGCTHRCAYCYACFMGRFTGHSEKWGTYLEPKRYESYRLPKNLEGKTILIGSVTDAYNPSEKKFEQMPSILRALTDCKAHVEILTKSNLVLRDIELIKAVPDIAVGISLSNINDEDNRIIEPGASSAAERIDALKKLHEAGIKTYLFIAPYLPGITDMKKLCDETEGSVDYVCVENLNLRGSYKPTMLGLIKKLHPDVYDLWDDIYLKKKSSAYWSAIEKYISELKKQTQMPIISYMYHEKIKKG